MNLIDGVVLLLTILITGFCTLLIATSQAYQHNQKLAMDIWRKGALFLLAVVFGASIFLVISTFFPLN